MRSVRSTAEQKTDAKFAVFFPQAKGKILIVRLKAGIAGATFANDVDILTLADFSRLYPGLDGDRIAVVKIKLAAVARVFDDDEISARAEFNGLIAFLK